MIVHQLPARKDPASRDAAAKARKSSDYIRGLCFGRISATGMSGATADEVAEAIGYPLLSVRPRISELKKLGHIVPSGMRRANASGNRTTVYIVPPQAQADAVRSAA